MTHIHQTDMLAQFLKKIFTIISAKIHFIFCSLDKQKTYTIDFKNKYYIRLLTEMLEYVIQNTGSPRLFLHISLPIFQVPYRTFHRRIKNSIWVRPLSLMKLKCCRNTSHEKRSIFSETSFES